MLRELHWTNLALMEDGSLEPGEGLHCLTGETGAGKSLLIGAIEVLLGLRSATGMLREGAAEGRVSGVFELRDEMLHRRVAERADVPLPDGQILLTRKMFESGRTAFSINGQPATAAMVQAVAELLVDVHGQHDHQSLLRPAAQLEMIDRYARCEELRREFGELHGQLRQWMQRAAALAASEQLRKQQLELYEFQAAEIDEADPVAGEFAETAARHKLLSNLQYVQADANAAYAAMYESEDSVVGRMHAVVGMLRKLAEIDAELSPIAEAVKTASAHVYDAAFELNRYLNRLELDPAELAEATERINTLHRIIHKYGQGGGLEGVLEYRQRIGRDIERLRTEEADGAMLAERIEGVRSQMRRVGGALAAQRREAAGRLRPLIERLLAELGMGHATFDVQWRELGEEEAGPSGMDAAEMMVSANPGHAPGPLRKIASGGEMSRIVLAIKSILAAADQTPLLIFDEIDANIGGRIGSIVGQKLRAIGEGRQVFCITHLPQIAAYAQRHWKIVKRVEGGVASTAVERLEDRAMRVRELAEMLTGKRVSEASERQAEELLALAAAGGAAEEVTRNGKGERNAGGKRSVRNGSKRSASRPRLRLTA